MPREDSSKTKPKQNMTLNGQKIVKKAEARLIKAKTKTKGIDLTFNGQQTSVTGKGKA